jgi:hypothetical protein
MTAPELALQCRAQSCYDALELFVLGDRVDDDLFNDENVVYDVFCEDDANDANDHANGHAREPTSPGGDVDDSMTTQGGGGANAANANNANANSNNANNDTGIPLNVRVEGVLDPLTGELVLAYGTTDDLLFDDESLGSEVNDDEYDSNDEDAEGNDYPDEEDGGEMEGEGSSEEEDERQGKVDEMAFRNRKVNFGKDGPVANGFGNNGGNNGFGTQTNGMMDPDVHNGGYDSSDNDDVDPYDGDRPWRGFEDASGDVYDDGWGEGFREGYSQYAYDDEEDD